MKVQDLMTRNVACCGVDDSLHRAAQLMWDSDCGCVPVVDASGRLRGMLTDRDVCMAAYTQDLPISSVPVRTAMSKDVLSCSPEDSIESAERLMQQRQIRRVPVSRDGRLVGVLSLCDIVRSVRRPAGNDRTNEGVMATLLRITEPPGKAARGPGRWTPAEAR